MADRKRLREMSADEIAQLSPEQFKELANDHNDHLELRESAYERILADASDPANYPVASRETLLRELNDLKARSYEREAMSERDFQRVQEIHLALRPDLPDPNAEVDKVLEGLVDKKQTHGQERKSLFQLAIEAVKAIPENIRARNTDFSKLLDHQDDHERENSPLGKDDRW